MSESPTLYTRLGGHAGILRLITPFYARVRRDPLLGPIFNERIQDWDSHLAKITEFWAGMTDGPGLYPGGMGRHFFLPIDGAHFDAWLAAWDANARTMLAPAEADEISALARRIGDDLQAMLARRRALEGR